MNKTTSRMFALLLFVVVAVIALSGSIIWLNFWTALSAALVIMALTLLFRKDNSKKKDEYKPQVTLQSQLLQTKENGYNPRATYPSQSLQSNTDNVYNINNSPNAVIQVIASERNQNEKSSEA